MTQTRTLRVGSKGDDVFRVKQRLFALGCYAPHITQVTTSNFGRDTQRAVVNFQAQNALQADGVIGPLTLAALLPEDATAQPVQIEIGTYPNISKTKLASILAALEQPAKSDAQLCRMHCSLRLIPPYRATIRSVSISAVEISTTPTLRQT